jgi:hypothetical protein
MIGFSGTSVTSSLNHTYYSAIADLHNLKLTVAHTLGLSVFTSRLLATDLNTETSTSTHYEVFLPFLVQSTWNLGTQLKTLPDCLLSYSRPSYNSSARTPQQTPVTCQTASSLVRYQRWAWRGRHRKRRLLYCCVT